MKIRLLVKVVCAVSVVFVLLLSGCGGCGFWGNDAIWKSWDHLKFSATGYHSATVDDAKKSTSERWWGCEVPVNASGTRDAQNLPKK